MKRNTMNDHVFLSSDEKYYEKMLENLDRLDDFD
jgi:hypothetical protein